MVLSWSINFFSRADVVNLSKCVCVLAHTLLLQAIYWLMSPISEVKPTLDRCDISFRETSPPLPFICITFCHVMCRCVFPPSHISQSFLFSASIRLPLSALCPCLPLWHGHICSIVAEGLILKALCRLTHPNSRLSGTHTHTYQAERSIWSLGSQRLLKHQPHQWWLMDFNFLFPCSFLCLPAGALILGCQQLRRKERRCVCRVREKRGKEGERA